MNRLLFLLLCTLLAWSCDQDATHEDGHDDHLEDIHATHDHDDDGITEAERTAAYEAIAAKTNFTAAEIKEQSEGWEAMMHVHDEVMPIMGEMNRIARTLKQSDDAAKVAVATQLNDASEGMMEWMARGHNLKALRDTETHEKIMEYIHTQTVAIEAVARQMTSSLERGRELAGS